VFGLLKKAVFTRLGWIGIAGHRSRVVYVTMGHRRESSAWRRLHSARYDADPARAAGTHDAADWLDVLADRLEAYAAGQPDDFRDVKIDLDRHTSFQRQVLRACRRIGYGQTASYADLAARCGSPGAARAVGNVMANNRLPLIVPCHRVVGSAGRLGGFSAPGGLATKRRLLELESTHVLC
jgi:methylated-DNA-[protein]-cysteine S-methyltransferase